MDRPPPLNAVTLTAGALDVGCGSSLCKNGYSATCRTIRLMSAFAPTADIGLRGILSRGAIHPRFFTCAMDYFDGLLDG